MSVKAEIARRIVKLRERKDMKPADFARALDTSASRVSDWEGGVRPPSPKAYIRLASLASGIGDYDAAVLFWREAGIPDADLFLTARAVARKRGEQSARELGMLRREIGDLKPRSAALGQTVFVPEYRETQGGRVSGGADLPFPADLVARPASMILLSFDEELPLMESVPGGSYLLDTSAEGTEVVSDLFGAGLGLMVRYEFVGEGGRPLRRAVHVGRPFLRADDDVRVRLRLSQSDPRKAAIELGTYVDREASPGLAEGGLAARHSKDMQILRRAAAEVRLHAEFRIMGVVYGIFPAPPREQG